MAVLHAGFLLQSCLFEDFWKESVAFAEKVPGYLESVRAYILTAISRSHSAISRTSSRPSSTCPTRRWPTSSLVRGSV